MWIVNACFRLNGGIECPDVAHFPVSERQRFLRILVIGFGFSLAWLTLLVVCRATMTKEVCTLPLVADQFVFLLVLLPITSIAIFVSC